MGLSSSSDQRVYPNIPQLGVLFGPTSTGLYYVKEPTWFSWRHIFLRYRFRSGKWEWCTSGDSTRETSWARIPARIPAHLAITPANATAICYLRDNSTRPHFARHIVEEAPLGRGAFGEVRRVKFGLIMGHDRFLPANCDVAMKTICILPNRNAQLQAMNQAIQEALLNEVTTLRQLSGLHPAVLKMYQCIEYGGFVAMVSEYCSGGTAQSLIPRPGDAQLVNPVRIYRLMSHCLQALSFLHRNGVIHRDIKPDNIFLTNSSTPDGEIFKLGDFGLCRIMSGQGVVSNRGAIAYQSPEVIVAGMIPQTSPKVDVWALGMTVFVMCAKRFPFVNQMVLVQPEAVPVPAFNDILPRNPYDQDTQDFVRMCLTRDVNARPSSEELCRRFNQKLLAHSLPQAEYLW